MSLYTAILRDGRVSVKIFVGGTGFSFSASRTIDEC